MELLMGNQKCARVSCESQLTMHYWLHYVNGEVILYCSLTCAIMSEGGEYGKQEQRPARADTVSDIA